MIDTWGDLKGQIKRALVLIGLGAISIHSWAEAVSLEEAESKARKFLTQQLVQGERHGTRAREVDVVRVKLTTQQRHRIVAKAGRVSTNESQQDPFYIFNRADGEGFVIISGESETSEVLAYSDEGAFHPECIEQGAESFLQYYATEIGRIRDGEAVGRREVRKTGKQLLLKTVNIAQDALHFNSKYAPTYKNKLCLPGCGPVAMATVMAYHKWPVTARTGSDSYTTATNKIEVSCDYGAEKPIDWSYIKNVTTSGSKTSTECSRLLKMCGVSIHADYDPNYTNAILAGIVYGLREVFDYDACTTFPRSMVEDEDEWDDLVMGELDNDRPLIVCAQGGINDWDRHIFVVDGYNTMGQYHYNLGWGGKNNGYYTDGKISSSNKYWCDGIVYGIKPCVEENVAGTTACLAVKNVRQAEMVMDELGYWNAVPLDDDIKKGKEFIIAAFGLQNCYHKTLNGHIRAELHSMDGKQKSVISDILELSGLQYSYYYTWYYLTCKIPATVKLLPTDYVSLSFRWQGTSKWLPIYCIDDAVSYVPVDRETADGITVPIVPKTTNSSLGFYDLQGRELSAPSKRGVYIKDGRMIIEQ